MDTRKRKNRLSKRKRTRFEKVVRGLAIAKFVSDADAFEKYWEELPPSIKGKDDCVERLAKAIDTLLEREVIVFSV